LGQKSKLRQKKQFEKNDFLGFIPKPLPILDFNMCHWKKCKDTANNKKVEIFKMFYFVKFSAVF